MSINIVDIKKNAEIIIAEEFLNLMGYEVIGLPEKNENPDLFIVIREEEEKQKKIGVELTDFHVDATPPESSPGRNVHRFWQQIQNSIRQQVRTHESIQHVDGYFSLNLDALLKWEEGISKKDKASKVNKLAQDLADELIKFALESSVAPDGKITVSTFSDDYPLLKDYIREIRLSGTGKAFCISWECKETITSSIGVSEKEITSIIEDKKEKFSNPDSKYDWRDAEERWLLISASGTTVFNSAGPIPGKVDWDRLDLQSACSSCGVDRIFFWERMYNWYKEIWPGKPAVQHEWRARKIQTAINLENKTTERGNYEDHCRGDGAHEKRAQGARKEIS